MTISIEHRRSPLVGRASRRRSPAWMDWPVPSLGPLLAPLVELESVFPERWEDRDAIRLEEFRDADELVIRAELPGIDPDRDVEITMAPDSLSITAERREAREERDGGDQFRTEFRYGRFSRTIGLPAGVSSEDVAATYGDGILEVRLRLPGEGDGAPSRIPVQRTGAQGGS